MTGLFDRFSKRYDRMQQEKKGRAAAVVAADDSPVPDAPVEQARRQDAPDRNAPCPCGSGKKHKKCCGKPA